MNFNSLLSVNLSRSTPSANCCCMEVEEDVCTLVGSGHGWCELIYSGHSGHVPCLPSKILLQSCVKDSTAQYCVIHGVCVSSLSYWVQHGPFSFHLYSRRTTQSVSAQQL